MIGFLIGFVAGILASAVLLVAIFVFSGWALWNP